MTAYEVEQEFRQFIDFGKVFDKTTRSYLVKYLYSKISNLSEPEESVLESKYLEYVKHSLDKILDKEPLLNLLTQYEGLGKQITRDVLKWLKKIDKKITEENPYHSELTKLKAYAHKPTYLWHDAYQSLLQDLSAIYKPEELDTDFYRNRMAEELKKAPQNLKEQNQADANPSKAEIDVLIDDLLAQWDALLMAKILSYQVEELEKEQEGFSQILEAKTNEYKRLLNLVTPFASAAGRYWDISRGLWKDASFDLLDKYEQFLQDEESIRKLADLLGKMREAEIELEEETIEEVIVKKEWVKDHHKIEEIGGVHQSDNLSTMLTSEAALLAEPQTESLFYHRFADKNLQTLRYEGKSLVTSDKVNFFVKQKQKLKEKGPFILCIDTSGSMHGMPSHVAKVLAFAIMKMAANEQRKCYLINFSIGIKSINLHDIASSMDKIIEFLSMSFDGGTDVTPAMAEALRILQTNDYKDADVLMVSDFIMFSLREEILEQINIQQNRGTKFHSLILSTRSNIEVLEAFDNCWTYDMESKEVMRQMLDDLQQLTQEPEF